jgi:hypothetical protein
MNSSDGGAYHGKVAMPGSERNLSAQVGFMFEGLLPVGDTQRLGGSA